jgi:hypothetical protein
MPPRTYQIVQEATLCQQILNLVIAVVVTVVVAVITITGLAVAVTALKASDGQMCRIISGTIFPLFA